MKCEKSIQQNDEMVNLLQQSRLVTAAGTWHSLANQVGKRRVSSVIKIDMSVLK